MLGQETKIWGYYPTPERPPTQHELDLWERAQKIARRVNLKALVMRLQYASLRQTHDFAVEHAITFPSYNLPGLENRMLTVLAEIKILNPYMAEVCQLSLGVRLSSSGNDIDIVRPTTEENIGWVIPLILAVIVVGGIIARWITLEQEVDDITTAYNGVLKRSDIALCADPTSKICTEWQHDKKTGGYTKRETIIDSVKGAISSIGSGAKSGLSWGLALAFPLLLWLYLPRKKER